MSKLFLLLLVNFLFQWSLHAQNAVWMRVPHPILPLLCGATENILWCELPAFLNSLHAHIRSGTKGASAIGPPAVGRGGLYKRQRSEKPNSSGLFSPHAIWCIVLKLPHWKGFVQWRNYKKTGDICWHVRPEETDRKKVFIVRDEAKHVQNDTRKGKKSFKNKSLNKIMKQHFKVVKITAHCSTYCIGSRQLARSALPRQGVLLCTPKDHSDICWIFAGGSCRLYSRESVQYTKRQHVVFLESPQRRSFKNRLLDASGSLPVSDKRSVTLNKTGFCMPFYEDDMSPFLLRYCSLSLNSTISSDLLY